MAFQGLDFVFNGASSKDFNLFLANTKSGENAVSLGGKYEVLSDRTNLSSNYLFGMIEKEPFVFDLAIRSWEELDRQGVSAISRWLFSHKTYKKLEILQEDMENIYYMCKLNEPSLVTYANKIIGFDCKVVCDCPYAYMKPVVLNESIMGEKTITINNTCDSNNYTPVLIRLYPNRANGVVSITNLDDANWQSKITNLVQGEVIELDSNLKIIKSDRVDYNFERFNKKFIRLVPNTNRLVVSGDVSKIEITYQFFRRVGA